MAYEDKEQRREFRHTVRFKKADDQLITVLAAEKELQKIGLGGQQQAASMGSAALHC